MPGTQSESRGPAYWQTQITNVKERLKNQTESPQAATSVPSFEKLAKAFDHTLLKPEATAAQVQLLCEEALKYRFATVCIREPFVSQAASILKDSGVLVCCVVGFHDPTASTLEAKLGEADAALKSGAQELDMVINWPLLKAAEHDKVFEELMAFRNKCPKDRVTLKVILETSQLSDEEITAACVLASEADFDFVKTSTGFLGHGAKAEHVRLMHRICEVERRNMAVKASGGIRSVQDAITMLQAGASRLGASASVVIMNEYANANGKST